MIQPYLSQYATRMPQMISIALPALQHLTQNLLKAPQRIAFRSARSASPHHAAHLERLAGQLIPNFHR